ncbi:putative porin [Uliginosibacterium sp. H3]|uniref:Porin n=1 Tax=Uliginosibacterium silvisoli TaxID=3114758 RepID=A0ABU6K4F4_9RHOO|nr:putative porin [Uliginosibacterium sp. H3]
MNRIQPLNALRPIALAVMLIAASGAAHADERESMEVLKQTTLNLINALVENGVLTREKANELIRTAEEKAARTVALSDPKPDGAATGAVAGAAVAGTLAGAAAPAPVRVQYIPESTKKEIRDQIRKEVLAQAREEHWADPNVIPSWLDRIKLSGDVLARYQFDNFASSNTPPIDYDQATNTTPGVMTRNAPLADNGFSSGNTQNDLNTERLRVRLGIEAKLTDAVRTEVRIATGSTDSRVSTTQPLGSAFNKYSLWLDRGFISYDPIQWVDVKAGRMSNPFVGSDLMWDDNLNFDGITFNVRDKKADGFVPYATFGAFPLQTESAPARPFSRTLFAVQAGAATDVSTKTRARFGLAYYNFHNLEGHVESEDNYLTGVGALTPTYANTEYQAGMRQKGNTLVRINAANDSSATIWGLSSRFKPIHLGFGFDNARTDAMHLIFSGDYVKNLAYDRNEIQGRTGVAPTDGSSSGYQLKFLVGTPAVRRKGEWNASVAFRNLGSDAVPDAFVDGTLGGGGTNLRGYILGFNYGLDLATTFGVRYMNARNIDSPSMVSDAHTFKQNTLQMDLGVGF